MRSETLARAIVVACAAVGVAAVAVAPRTSAAAEDDEWERPFDGVLAIPESGVSVNPPEDGFEPGPLAVATVLDGATGRPVPGATLTLFPESPWTGTVSFTEVVGRGTCDARGVAVVDIGDHEGKAHWIADAPGYAPTYEWGERPPPRMMLRRGALVRGRVLDPRGAPVVGALLDIFPGCSHSGRIREATTSNEGTFVLRDVRPDSDLQGCVQTAAGACRFEEGFGTLGRRPVDIALRTAIRVRGRFVDDEFRPVAGVTIRGTEFRRWPVAVSDADGRWELPAFERGDEPIFVGDGPEVDHDYTSDWMDAEDVVHVVRIDRDTAEPEGPDDDAAADLVIRLADGTAAPETRVLLVRPDDGYEVGAEWWRSAAEAGEEDEGEDNTDGVAPADAAADADDEDDEAGPATPRDTRAPPPEEFTLPSGDYLLRPRSPFEPVTFPQVALHIAPGRRTAIDIVGTPQPTLRVEGRLPVPADVTLVVPGYEGPSIDEGDLSKWTPHLPASGDAWLRIEPEDHRLAFFAPVGPVKDGVRTAVLDLPMPHWISVTAPARVDEMEMTCDGFEAVLVREGATAWTYARGPMQLDVEIDDEVRRFEFDLPDAPHGLVLDWNTGAAVTEPAQVVVTAEDVPDVTFRVQGHGFAVGGGSDATAVPPCRVTVSRPGHQPLDRIFTEPATVVHRWGPCALRVAVKDAEGSAQASVVSVDGVLHWTRDGILELRGLEPGPHEVIVDPVDPELRGAEIRVVLAAGGKPGAMRDRGVVLERRE